MQDVCWIHNQRFDMDNRCPDCHNRDLEIRENSLPVLLYRDVSIKSGREPGDRIWNVLKGIMLGIVFLFLLMMLGAILFTK